MAPPDREAPVKRRMILFFATLAALVALAIAWKWTPMREWLEIDHVVGQLRLIGQQAGPAAAIAGLAAASALAIPLSVMTVIAVIAFGALAGFLYCIGGACIGGAISYGLGRYLGRPVVERMAGPRLNRISRQLAGHGILSVIAIRLVPAAPFAVINMLAGASHIRFRDFMLGTAIGMLPGTLAIIVFIEQIIQAIREPGGNTLVIVAITAVLIVGGGLAIRRWLAPETERLAGDQPTDQQR